MSNALDTLVYGNHNSVEMPDGLVEEASRSMEVPEPVIRAMVPIWQPADASAEEMNLAYCDEQMYDSPDSDGIHRIPQDFDNARATYEFATREIDAPDFDDWSNPVPVVFPEQVTGFDNGSIQLTEREHYWQTYQSRYIDSPDHLEKFVSEILQVDVTWLQSKALHSIQDHPRTAWSSVNSMGKSYLIACLLLGWVYTSPKRAVLLTTSHYNRLSRSGWSDLQDLHGDLQERFPWLDWGRRPSDNYKYQPDSDNHPAHRVDGISPSDPSDLSGSHDNEMLVIIDEIDKPGVTDKHLREAKSSLAERMVAFGNPPREAGNVFAANVLDSPTWHTIEHNGGFDSPNVRIALGEDDTPVPALIDPDDIEEYWQDEHPTEEYPGLEQASQLTKANGYTGLSEEWYLRVTGESPPSEAMVNAVWDEDTVTRSKNWYNVSDEVPEDEFVAIGIDLANQGDDHTVAIGITEDEARVWKDADLTSTQNLQLIDRAQELADVVVVDDNSTEILQSHSPRFDDVIAFKSQYTTSAKRPKSGTNHPRVRIGGVYKDWRAFAHKRAASWMEDGGAIEPNRELIEQLTAAANGLRWKGDPDDETSVYLNSKKDILPLISASSPDHLDAFVQACFGLWYDDEHSGGRVYTVGFDEDHPVANALRGGKPENKRFRRGHPHR